MEQNIEDCGIAQKATYDGVVTLVTDPEKVLEVASDAILDFMEDPWENTKELAGNIRDSVVDAVWRSTPQEISEDAGEILGDVLTAVATGGGGKAAASGAKIAGNKLLALGKTGVKEFVEGLGDLGKIGAKNAVYVGATTGIENAAKNSFINRLMMMASEAGDEAKKLAGAVEGATSKVDDIATVAGKTGSVANTVTSTTGELIENAVIGTPIVEGIKKIDKTIKNELTEKITREVVGGTTEKTTIQMLEEATDDIVEAGTKVTSKVDDVAEAGANAAGQTTAKIVVKENSCANGSGVKISGEKPKLDVDGLKDTKITKELSKISTQNSPKDTYIYQKYKNSLIKDDVLKHSVEIIKGEKFGDQKLIAELTKDGSSITDWSKMESLYEYTTEYGTGRIHYYKNRKTGKVSYYDVKMKIPAPKDLKKNLTNTVTDKGGFWIIDLDENLIPIGVRE